MKDMMNRCDDRLGIQTPPSGGGSDAPRAMAAIDQDVPPSPGNFSAANASRKPPDTLSSGTESGRFMRIGRIAVSMVMVSLPFMSHGFAQTPDDHAARAHGKPIVKGHPVQPTPGVVNERWRHHEMMLQSQPEQSGRASSAPLSGSRQTPSDADTRK